MGLPYHQRYHQEVDQEQGAEAPVEGMAEAVMLAVEPETVEAEQGDQQYQRCHQALHQRRFGTGRMQGFTCT